MGSQRNGSASGAVTVVGGRVVPLHRLARARCPGAAQNRNRSETLVTYRCVMSAAGANAGGLRCFVACS